jgi:hypothetical protein
MSTEIDQDATLILRALAMAPRNEYVEGQKLVNDTGLDVDRINDALALLVDAGHAEWTQVMGTAPFDFGDAMITPRGRHEFQRLSQEPDLPALAPQSVGALSTSTSTIRLFISHCSDDVELATRLVALFRVALNLPSSAIRCSSVDGYRLPGGADTDEQLRREVHDAEAFVGIVSTASVRSLYVLFELGARWGAHRHLIPLLAPGTATSALGGPLGGLNALSAGSVSQLHQLLSELAVALSLNLESAAGYHDQLQAVAGLVARPPDSHSVQATQVTGVSVDLPKEAEGVLKVIVTSNEPTLEDLAGQLRLSERKLEYFLDVLKERGLADEIMYSGAPSEFVVTSKGRKYLFEHGMLE